MTVAMAVVVGCGSPSTPEPESTGSALEITISHGSVTPTNAVVQAKVGQPVTLRVNSDLADELHVHSTPDHSFDVEPKPEQTFEFTPEVPGSVEVELHHLNRTVASIQVRQ